jgi:hypothetical protein
MAQDLWDIVYVLPPCKTLTGDSEQSLGKLDNIVNYFHGPKVQFVTCGDINTDILLKVIENNVVIPY